MKLSKYERETIINFNEGGQEASIYTHNTKLKKRLQKFSQQYPELCCLERADRYGSETYLIGKTRLSIRLLPPVSKERREKISKVGSKYGFQKTDESIIRMM